MAKCIVTCKKWDEPIQHRVKHRLNFCVRCRNAPFCIAKNGTGRFLLRFNRSRKLCFHRSHKLKAPVLHCKQWVGAIPPRLTTRFEPLFIIWRRGFCNGQSGTGRFQLQLKLCCIAFHKLKAHVLFALQKKRDGAIQPRFNLGWNLGSKRFSEVRA